MLLLILDLCCLWTGVRAKYNAVFHIGLALVVHGKKTPQFSLIHFRKSPVTSALVQAAAQLWLLHPVVKERLGFSGPL